MNRIAQLSLCSLLATAAACGDDEPVTTPDAGMMMGALEIVGVWANAFGPEDVITEATFNGAAIISYDNAANELVSQNAADDAFNPNLFNKVVWTEPSDGVFHFCTVDFGLDTAEAAQNTPKTADANDLAGAGCGGFPWTRLRPALSIRGRYMSNFGGMETVTSTSWSQGGPSMGVVDWDEASRFVVTQNAPEAMFGANTFNKIEFTAPDGMGSFFYCFVDFGLMSAQAARTSTQTADASNPEMSGCGGFSWTRLDPL